MRALKRWSSARLLLSDESAPIFSLTFLLRVDYLHYIRKRLRMVSVEHIFSVRLRPFSYPRPPAARTADTFMLVVFTFIYAVRDAYPYVDLRRHSARIRSPGWFFSSFPLTRDFWTLGCRTGHERDLCLRGSLVGRGGRGGWGGLEVCGGSWWGRWLGGGGGRGGPNHPPHNNPKPNPPTLPLKQTKKKTHQTQPPQQKNPIQIPTKKPKKNH